MGRRGEKFVGISNRHTIRQKNPDVILAIVSNMSNDSRFGYFCRFREIKRKFCFYFFISLLPEMKPIRIGICVYTVAEHLYAYRIGGMQSMRDDVVRVNQSGIVRDMQIKAKILF